MREYREDRRKFEGKIHQHYRLKWKEIYSINGHPSIDSLFIQINDLSSESHGSHKIYQLNFSSYRSVLKRKEDIFWWTLWFHPGLYVYMLTKKIRLDIFPFF